jgi:hypothetical protein
MIIVPALVDFITAIAIIALLGGIIIVIKLLGVVFGFIPLVGGFIASGFDSAVNFLAKGIYATLHDALWAARGIFDAITWIIQKTVELFDEITQWIDDNFDNIVNNILQDIVAILINRIIQSRDQSVKHSDDKDKILQEEINKLSNEITYNQQQLVKVELPNLDKEITKDYTNAIAALKKVEDYKISKDYDILNAAINVNSAKISKLNHSVYHVLPQEIQDNYNKLSSKLNTDINTLNNHLTNAINAVQKQDKQALNNAVTNINDTINNMSASIYKQIAQTNAETINKLTNQINQVENTQTNKYNILVLQFTKEITSLQQQINANNTFSTGGLSSIFSGILGGSMSLPSAVADLADNVAALETGLENGSILSKIPLSTWKSILSNIFKGVVIASEIGFFGEAIANPIGTADVVEPELNFVYDNAKSLYDILSSL